MRLLVSVRDGYEALAAAQADADIIDLKEPAAGALGALTLPAIRAIVAALRARWPQRPVSATVGDWPAGRIEDMLARVRDTAACGVDYVKVGVVAGDTARVHALVHALIESGVAVVPVLMADDGLDDTVVNACCAAPFPAVMLDTADKRAGSLLQRLDEATLRAFIGQVRANAKLAGLAGSLRLADAPRLAALAPDIAGFRTAVCDGGRSGRFSPARLRALAAAVGGHRSP
jgi:(5-formylfuran-3-yl)methyl phosphate synthase